MGKQSNNPFNDDGYQIVIFAARKETISNYLSQFSASCENITRNLLTKRLEGRFFLVMKLTNFTLLNDQDSKTM